MRKGQFVMGPAGSGKTTYCLEIYKNLNQNNFPIKIINLDPSLLDFDYPNSIDIRDLIKTSDVMEEFSLGPNGSLVFCMEYLMDNLNWLRKEILDSFEKVFLFDLPGQIELYSHSNLLNELLNFLVSFCEFTIQGVFLLDCQFISDVSKFIGGSLTALCCMISLEISHFNVLNKINLVKNIPKNFLEKYLSPNSNQLFLELNEISCKKFKNLNFSIIKLLDDFSMLKFIPLDTTRIDNLKNFFWELFYRVDFD
mmetsp:Transcript_47760/g.112714  ORF Transcript_47760/g.112714 Transcript_47760/m.112714 type:complete len:253 (-) Transcript_47760:921-1679(-)